MKKIALFISLLLLVVRVSAQSINVDEARSLYVKSAENKEVCKKLYEKLAKIDEANQNLLLGYKGAVLAEMARHEKDAPKKLKLFKEGKRKLEQAIINDLENVELRFLRLSIQLHTPDVLHYNAQIKSDKLFIESNLEKLKNEKLKKSISEYMAKVAIPSETSSPK
ncbi:MAG TPA: hypothetical protein PLN13_12345 [Bacteroidia bacterium]|nr:hypothetical protein [Bacteroidia bacterium]HRH09363.1 hypothetical protein [Bacteroidia bacterium]